MLIRARTTEDRIAEIAKKFAGGIDGFTAGMKMETDANNAAKDDNIRAEALRRQQALQGFEVESKLSEQTGRQVPTGIGQKILRGEFVDPKAFGENPLTMKAEREQRLAERDNLKFNQDQEKYLREKTEAEKPFNQTRDYQKAAAIAGIKSENKKAGTPKQNEFAAAGYAKRARQAESELLNIPANIGTGTFAGLNDYLPEVAKPENQKLFEQAKRNFITANLRKESGASISDTEYANEDKKYFAQPGDTGPVLEQKKRAREQAILSLEAEGANALGRVGNAPAAQFTPPLEAIKNASREEKIRFLQGG